MEVIEVEIAHGVTRLAVKDGDCISLDYVKIIEATAQGILDARAKHPDMSLAQMYDEKTMPPDLREVHVRNDRAVLEAYGLPTDAGEEAIIKKLMEMYQEMAAK